MSGKRCLSLFFVCSMMLVLMLVSSCSSDSRTSQKSDSPAPQGERISGPGGLTLTLPPYGMEGSSSVSLQERPHDEGLVGNGEKRVSRTFAIVSDTPSVLFGEGVYSFSIPLTLSPEVRTDKLLLKVRLSENVVLPVYGRYNATSGAYEVNLAGIGNGWVMAVAEVPEMEVLLLPRGSVRQSQGWLTDLDWKTCEWVVINHTDMTEADIWANVMPDMWQACDVLARAGFRSPKIYVDSRFSPEARVVHLIKGTEQNDAGSHFRHGLVQRPGGDWQYTEEDARFTTDFLDADQLSALGQMYVNYDQYLSYNQKYGVSLGNIISHELFHAVQAGYDVRRTSTSLKPYLDGTATPLGQTYQDTGNSVTGPSVSVRILRPNEHARLYQALDDPSSPFFYTKQDFFAYVSRRYAGHSFAWVDQLFEYLNTQTTGRFGLTDSLYRELYRHGMDAAFRDLFGKGLPEIYTEYALDRAYEHSENAILRPLHETPADGFGRNTLATTLFKMDAQDTSGMKELDFDNFPAEVEFPRVEPLSCYAVISSPPVMDTGAGSQEMQKASFPLRIELEGGTLASATGGGIRIFLFLENSEGVMLENGKIEVQDITKPVQVPLLEYMKWFKILVLNTSLENRDVRARITGGPSISSISPSPAAPGSRIRIRGSGFGEPPGSADRVTLGGETMTEDLVWDNDEILFTLPATARTGKVQVWANGMASNEVSFTASAFPNTEWRRLLPDGQSVSIVFYEQTYRIYMGVGTDYHFVTMSGGNYESTGVTALLTRYQSSSPDTAIIDGDSLTYMGSTYTRVPLEQ